jgi:hypothetical protein
MEAENKKAAGNSQEKLTVNMVQFDAARTDFSNDQVMRLLGKKHLAWRIRITEMSAQKLWKELSISYPRG